MRIFNKKNIEIKSPNMRKGRLLEDKIFVKHHPAIEAVNEQGHWEVIAEYPNGGKDVEWRVDVSAVEAKEAWDEYEDILRYEEYTEEELNVIRKRPLTLQEKLALFIESIEEEVYPVELPKIGYMYQRMYSTVKNKIVWSLVPDPDNPIKFIAGMDVTEGLYYTDGTNISRCIESGIAKTLTSARHFKRLSEEEYAQ